MTRSKYLQPIVLAPAAIGVGLIIAALVGGVGLPSVALEIGGAFALAGVLIFYERKLGERLDAGISAVKAEIDEQIEEVKKSVDERFAHLAAVDERGNAATRKRYTDVVEAWIADPSVETFNAMADLATRLNVSTSVPVRLETGAIISLTPYRPANGDQPDVTVQVVGPTSHGLGRRRWVRGRQSIDVVRQDIVDALAKGRVLPLEFSIITHLVEPVAREFERRFREIYGDGEPAG